MLVLLGLSCFSHKVQAEDGSTIYIMDDFTLEKGKTTIRWSSFSDWSFYDVELADNPQFMDAKLYSTEESELTIEKSALGKHGGRFYLRIRANQRETEEGGGATIGEWSEPKEMVMVKIDKTNFPGMYSVIKNGGKKINILNGDVEKVIYDKNKDGWLDTKELNEIYEIVTTDISKKEKGKYKLIKATSISSFKGVEFFPRLHNIKVARYSGKKADLSECSATNVEFLRHTARQLTVIAPKAKSIRIIDPIKNYPQIDLRKCSSAVIIGVSAENTSGNGSRTGSKIVKLPSEKKNLKLLELCEVHVKTLNLNAYTNLQQLFMYRCKTKSVKVNKCKNLRYVYICQCKKIKSLNLKFCKKLRGADFYQTPGLTKKTVKKSKSGKYTWNKGRWWEKTSAYKKDMSNFYKLY